MNHSPTDHLGIFKIEVLQFRTIGVISSSTKMCMLPESDQAVFSLKGDRIYINKSHVLSRDTVSMVFLVDRDKFLFSGAAFMDRTDQEANQAPEITIGSESRTLDNNTKIYSKMKIHNYDINEAHSIYDYVVFIQNRRTSELGIIDPDIETNSGHDM